METLSIEDDAWAVVIASPGWTAGGGKGQCPFGSANKRDAPRSVEIGPKR